MKAKRWISLLLAVSMMLGVLAMPASAAAQQPESTAVVSEELPDAAALAGVQSWQPNWDEVAVSLSSDIAQWHKATDSE